MESLESFKDSANSAFSKIFNIKWIASSALNRLPRNDGVGGIVIANLFYDLWQSALFSSLRDFNLLKSWQSKILESFVDSAESLESFVDSIKNICV